MKNAKQNEFPVMNSAEPGSILEIIQAGLVTITSEQIERESALMDPPQKDEKILAVIQAWLPKALWTLAHQYDGHTHLAAHAANFQAVDRADRKAYEAQFARLNAIKEIARELAWAEMRSEANAWGCPVGLRENFTLTQAPEEAAVTSFPGSVLQSVVEDMLRRAVDPDAPPAPEPPKRKPQ